MSKLNKRQIIELIWFFLGSFILLTAIFEIIKNKPFSQIYKLLILSSICYLMFIIRKILRKKNLNKSKKIK